jgi:NADPH-ferrihemoprotein reductase
MDASALVYPLATLSALLIGVSAALLYVRVQVKTSANFKARSAEPEEKLEVVRVLYGTQTGTAEKFAKQLVTQLSERYGQNASFRAQDMETYDHVKQLGSERILLYLVATYGDGEPPDNAQVFHQWMGPKVDAVFSGDADEVLPVRPSEFATTFRWRAVIEDA